MQFSVLIMVFAMVGFMGMLTLALPAFLSLVLFEQDLKKKYGASWAIVTGGSSGIGKAISEKLCEQGLNVIILAVPDKLLENTQKELVKKYPGVKVEAVAADLSKTGFMDSLAKVTKDRDIQLIFCNAGFMLSGLFADTHIGKTQANAAVNVGCHLELTHEYVNKMLAKKLKGAVFFTSSPAWMLPSPTAAMYAGTKAFITHFGVSLAAELKVSGVDVCVVHPSPVASNFYANAPDGAEINFFKSTALGPEVLVSAMFASVGRLVICNQGYFPKVMGVLHHLIDFSFLSEVVANTAHTAASFKQAQEAGKKRD